MAIKIRSEEEQLKIFALKKRFVEKYPGHLIDYARERNIDKDTLTQVLNGGRTGSRPRRKEGKTVKVFEALISDGIWIDPIPNTDTFLAEANNE